MQENKVNHWSKRMVVVCMIACLLIISWIIPLTRIVWDYLDAITYLSLHSFFLKTELSQKFWAIMNSRIADNLSHVIFIVILGCYVFSDQGKCIKKRLLQAIFVLIAVVLSVLISKGVQSELSSHFSIKRNSPSIVLGHDVELSKVLPGLTNIKDSSRRSFPGDHAMTLFLLCGFIFWLTKSIPLRIITILVTVLFTMPRLISGGHWLTDLVMGSLPISIVFLALWLELYSIFIKIKFKNKLN